MQKIKFETSRLLQKFMLMTLCIFGIIFFGWILDIRNTTDVITIITFLLATGASISAYYAIVNEYELNKGFEDKEGENKNV